MLSLMQLFQGEIPSSPPMTVEQEADVALRAAAIAAYEQSDGVRVDEKRGWCLVESERWTEAVAVLAGHRDDLSSAGLAPLGVASVGGWRQRYRLNDSARSTFDQ